MKIKKIGHCCLLIETNGVTILTDPGAFTVEQNRITGIDVILITHEHADHLHVGSLKEIIANNPEVKIITNISVGRILDAEGIQYEILEGRDTRDVNNVLIEAFDSKHEEVFEELGQVKNTGYFIAEQLFYPGDSYCNPLKKVDILALPVAGPWCRIADAIRYALEVQPRIVFPVHDGMLQEDKIGASHKIPEKVLIEHGVEFVALKNGEEHVF